MKKRERWLNLLVWSVLTACLTATAVQAELKAAGPLSPANGFPVWYQDTAGVALDLCLDPNDAFCGVLMAPLPRPNDPVAFPTNFPDEAFWWTADASITVAGGGSADLILAMEAAFANGPPAVSDQISFGRIRIRIDTPVTGLYKITHPYGYREINVGLDAVTGLPEGIFDTLDIGATGQQFIGVLSPVVHPEGAPNLVNFGPFLRWTDPDYPVVDQATGRRYVGNPAVAHAVTGSPFGTNFFRVEGPAGANLDGLGGNIISTDRFLVSGKIIGLDITPAVSPSFGPVTVDTSSAAKLVTVTNLSGGPVTFTDSPATLTDPATGSASADFALDILTDNTCEGATLAADATCSFGVIFSPAPTATALRTVRVTVSTPTAGVPPAVATLTGTAQYTVTSATTASNGSTQGVLSPTGTLNLDAGSAQNFVVTPNSGYFPLVLVDGVRVALSAANSYSFNPLSAHHTINVKFIRNGDLDEDGVIKLGDALRALQIATGMASPTDSEAVAADVGPLTANKPKADGFVDVSDVLVILRRAINLDPSW